MTEIEIRKQLDELFDQYNTPEMRAKFNFARFYGYCEGVLMDREMITLKDFIAGFKYILEVSK